MINAAADYEEEEEDKDEVDVDSLPSWGSLGFCRFYYNRSFILQMRKPRFRAEMPSPSEQGESFSKSVSP